MYDTDHNDHHETATLIDYVNMILARPWVVGLPVIVALAITALYCLFTAPVYKADTTLRVRDPQGGMMFYTDSVGVNLPTEMELIKSRSVMDDVTRTLMTDARFAAYRGGKYFQDDVDSLAKDLEVDRVGRDKNIVQVTVKSHDPRLAAAMANLVAETSIAHNLDFKQREARQVRNYIEEQQLVVSKKLVDAEERLRAFLQDNKISDMRVQGASHSTDPLMDIDPLVTLERQMMPLREKVASLSKIYNDDYPELKRAKAELGILAGYKRKIQTGIAAMPEKKFEYTKYLREAEIYKRDYDTLGTAAQDARLKEVGVVSDYFIVDPALVPRAPAYPRVARSLLTSLLGGLIFGVFLALLLDYLDGSIKDAKEVERRYALPILGAIPHVDLKTLMGKVAAKRFAQAHKLIGAGEGREAALIGERLISHLAPKSAATEAYRQLFVSLSFVRPDEELKVLAVSSAGSGEGKSSTAANLAMVGASLGKRVLLIDGDLRKPVVHAIFKIAREPGLSDVMAGGASWRDAVRDTGIANFEVMTSGHIPSAPMLLFNSPRFAAFLSEIRDIYDLILIDTPPIVGMADTPIIASKTNGLLMVVSQGKTVRDAAEHAVQILGSVNAAIVGAVMNNTAGTRRYGYYGYGRYGGYGYGGYGGYHDTTGEESIVRRLYGTAAASGVVKRIVGVVRR